MAYLGESRLKELLILIKGAIDNVKPKISKAEGNIIEKKTDGIYAPETDLTGYAKSTDIPTDVSELNNDAKYQNDTDVENTLKDYAKSSDIIDELEKLTDVNITDVTNGQVLKYNADTEKWENGQGGGGGTTDISKQPQNAIQTKDDGIYVFDNIWTGTMAEYLAHADEIADGTNVKIKDDVKVDAEVSLAEFDFYSEEEQCIGCWIDGKPIYRKTYKIANFSVTTTGKEILIVSQEELKIDEFLKGYGKMLWGGTLKFQLPYFNHSSGVTIAIQSNATNITMFAHRSSGSTNVTNAVVTLEYTKTTDAENSFTPSMLTNKIGLGNLSDADIDEIIGGIKW